MEDNGKLFPDELSIRKGIVALPFLHFTLTAPKPPPELYPTTPKTLGDHIRKKRMDLGLLQRDLAEIIGVDECTIHNWECSHTRPHELAFSKIIAFLGYNPIIKYLDAGNPVQLKNYSEHLHKMKLDEVTTRKYQV